MNQQFSLWCRDDPFTEIGGKIREYGGLGFDLNMQLLCYFSEKKKIINLDIFAEKFSSLDLEMQQNFFDIFLKSKSKDKTEEIDFLYFLCSVQFNTSISIDEHTMYNVLSNAFRMNYDLELFSKNNLFFNKIFSCFADLLDLLLSSSSLDKKNVNRVKTNLQYFLDLFFDSFEECTEYSDAKIAFFRKIYDRFAHNQKKHIRLNLEPKNILKLDCIRDCSMIEDRKEENSFLEISDLFNSSDAIGNKKIVEPKKFETVLDPLKWPDAQLEKWLRE